MGKRIWSQAKSKYIIQDLDWIKEQIVKISKLNDDDVERELIITPIHDSYKKMSTIFFSLNGSPPRGFAIFNKDHENICFVSGRGDHKKAYASTILKEDLVSGDGN